MDEVNEVDPKPEEYHGLECPKCGCRHFFVVYTRPKKKEITRRKECRHCGKRITTKEKAQ